MENKTYPIDFWSYSSLTMFLRNALAFKKRYILKIYDNQISSAGLIGQAGHEALKYFYQGVEASKAIEHGLDYINRKPDAEINYGKTGTREKIVKGYMQAIDYYLAEAPKYDCVAVEEAIVEKIEGFPLPMKAIADLIINEGEDISIVDHKFTSSYTDGDLSDPVFIIQAMFNFYTVMAKYGKRPKRMIINECKTSKNTDGRPQIQQYIIEFDQYPHYFDFFKKLYNDVTRELGRSDKLFLPNFSDLFDGQMVYDVYTQDLIDVDAPVAIQHKTEQVDFVEKKFIPSTIDNVANQNFTEEEKIKAKLAEFGLAVEMRETYTGPGIVKYTMKPSRGRKMADFEKHDKDLALALKAKSVRIEAPIMGTDLIGVEIPNPERQFVNYAHDESRNGTLEVPIGVDVYGQTIVKDLADAPHLLIAGSTGSGKSVMINVLIKALSDQNSPAELGFVMIDPKRVELAPWNDLPHLLAPVIFDEDKAMEALNWLTAEMEHRYKQLEKGKHRNIDDYNTNEVSKMKKIVVIIDEFADLMLGGAGTSEKSIIRLAQKARAIGIHIVLGTQRPSVDVVTGLIKANLPTRIAFMTTSRTDSQVILDQSGAEQLIGKGDMLFLNPNVKGLQRLQGFYVWGGWNAGVFDYS